MASVPSGRMSASGPTNVVPLPALLVYAQGLGLERFLARTKRGLSSLSLALLWLVLAWRGSGRPFHLRLLAEPLLPVLLGLRRLPCARTLARSVRAFSAHDVRRSVETAY